MGKRLIFTFLLFAACKPTGSGEGADLAFEKPRPYSLYVPPSLDTTQPHALVILLHGYSANSASQDAYFTLSTLADQKGFYLALPDGTVDGDGNQFWNATDGCCDFGETGVDDVRNLQAIIADASATQRIDAKRVYLWGHSNGGFMAHRFACDRAELVAGIASLAGAVWSDASRCNPSDKVAVLQVHGTLDNVIRYEGGDLAVVSPRAGAYPSAATTVATWAQKNGCGAARVDVATTIDYDRQIAGNETKVSRHDCVSGGAAELWTVEGGGHVPLLANEASAKMWDFLLAHPKP